MSKDLLDLDEAFRAKASKAFTELNKSETLHQLGVQSVAISETKRELSVQMAYYSRGRMKDPADVRAMYNAAGLYSPSEAECKTPNTWTLHSKHLTGRAVDFVPVKDGRLWWNAPVKVLEEMGKIGKACGMSWGGDWKTKDYFHFEKN